MEHGLCVSVDYVHTIVGTWRCSGVIESHKEHIHRNSAFDG